MYKGNNSYSNDDNNDLDNLLGMSRIGYKRRNDFSIYSIFSLSSINDDEDNNDKDWTNVCFQKKGDDPDLFNNQNIEPSDNQKQSYVLTELSNILEQEQKKMKNDTSIIESKRKGNQINTIKRNLIQDIIPDYFNSSIKDPDKKIRKIDPELFKKEYKTIHDIIDISLKVIYSNNISKKEIKGNIKIDNNKIIIKNIEEHSDLDNKMNLKFRQVLKIFFNIETKLIADYLKEDLIDYKQYFSSIKNKEKKKHNYKFLEKFIHSLNEVYLMTKYNMKQSEKTTGPDSKNLSLKKDYPVIHSLLYDI